MGRNSTVAFFSPLHFKLTIVMRFFSIVAPLFALSVGLVDATAQPRSAHGLSQMTRRELELRANHPDLFNKRDHGDSQPSLGSGPPDCDFVLPHRKRDVEQVLNAREMASFLVGRGTFTSSVFFCFVF